MQCFSLLQPAFQFILLLALELRLSLVPLLPYLLQWVHRLTRLLIELIHDGVHALLELLHDFVFLVLVLEFFSLFLV